MTTAKLQVGDRKVKGKKKGGEGGWGKRKEEERKRFQPCVTILRQSPVERRMNASGESLEVGKVKMKIESINKALKRRRQKSKGMKVQNTALIRVTSQSRKRIGIESKSRTG